MNNMEQLANEKAEALRERVTSDSRWNLQNELICQVFGFTLYGYVFGIGRLICFMDVEVINEIATSKLTTLGFGSQQGSHTAYGSLASFHGVKS
jgi:hypothetical protein